MDYADEGIAAPDALVTTLGELPELRDAMSLVWRIPLLWLAVLAVFVVAGWVG
jgi:AmpE protein